MIEAAPHISEMAPAQRRKARIAGVIGNVVEWYDFALYGYLAVIIGRLFFPTEDPAASILASYGSSISVRGRVWNDFLSHHGLPSRLAVASQYS
jgi:hypothetical protein